MVKLVRRGGPFFSLFSSVLCPFFWRLGVGGREFLCYTFLLVVCSIFRGSLDFKLLIVINLLQVVSPKSES